MSRASVILNSFPLPSPPLLSVIPPLSLPPSAFRMTPPANVPSAECRAQELLHGADASYILVSQVLGEGTFSTVFLGYNIETSEIVAIKAISLTSARSKEHSTKELSFLAALKSYDSFVKILDVIERDDVRYVVMKYYSMDLFDYTDRMQVLPDHICKIVFKKIVESVKILHDNNIVHLDLKLENFLIDYLLDSDLPNSIILSDFGFSDRTVLDDGTKKFQTRSNGSIHYLSPEIVARAKSCFDGKKADIWSLGVMLYAMLSESFHVSGRTEREILHSIIEFDVDSLDCSYLSKGAKNLVISLLSPNPNDRPSIAEVLEDPWLSS